MAEKPIPHGVNYFPPDRVVTRVHRGNLGAAVEQAISHKTAAAQGIEPDVILIRGDGWTLGARWEDAGAAYQISEQTWVFFVYQDGTRWRLRRLGSFHPLVERVIRARHHADVIHRVRSPRRPNDNGGTD